MFFAQDVNSTLNAQTQIYISELYLFVTCMLNIPELQLRMLYILIHSSTCAWHQFHVISHN